MSSLFDRLYRYKGEFLDADFFDTRFRSVDDRLTPLEEKGDFEAETYRSIEDRVLARSESVIQELRARLVQITNLEWLVAFSATPATLTEGADVSLAILPEQRALFAPGPFSIVSRSGTPDDYAVVRTVGYDRALGQYDFTVVSSYGDPGPHADWVLGAVASSTLAQMQVLAQVKAIRSELLAARQTAQDAAAAAATSAGDAAGSASTATGRAAFADTRATDANNSANAALGAATRAETAATSLDTSTFVAKDGTRAFTGQQTFAAPAAGRASAVLPSGTDPSAPVEGALWNAGGTLKGFLGGVTRVFAFLGIAQSWGALQTFLTGVVLTNLGSDPASPANGQLWTRTSSGLFGRLNGVTQRILDGSLFATTAEATAGTATDRVMNPARVKEAVLALAPTEGQATDLACFGDGSDGDFMASSGTVTLTRDTYYRNLTLSGSAVLNPNGFRVFVSGVLDISALTGGYIGRVGGTGGTGGPWAGNGTSPGGALAAALAAGSLGGGGEGHAGLTGIWSQSAGNFAPRPAYAQLFAGGGSGLPGASGATVQTSANASAYPVTPQYRPRRLALDLVFIATLLTGGVGGQGGGAGGGNGGTTSNSSLVPGGGGGGGGGGGVVAIFARTITRSASTAAGAIRSMGGNGGNGGPGTTDRKSVV